MPESIREYLYHLSSGTIAHYIGSPKYADIDRAINKAFEIAENRGILESKSYTLRTIENLLKEAAA